MTPYSLRQVSGITSVVQSLARGLKRRGHRTSIIAPRFPVDPPETSEAWEIPVGTAMVNLVLVAHAIRTLWRNRAAWDILNLHQAHPLTLVAALLARSLGRPAVTTFHLRPPPAAGLRGVAERLWTGALLRISSHLVFVSAETRRSFRATGTVIYNGVDVNAIRAALGEREQLRHSLGLQGFIIAFFGRITRNKGVVDLLKAVRQTRNRGHQVSVLATGETPPAEREALEREIATLGTPEIFRNLGPRADRLALLAAVDAVALPSYQEGFPMVVLEGMAAGLPIVASRVGGTPELVRDNVDGILVPPGDVDALSTAIERVATDKILRTRLARNVRERVMEFDVERMIASYLVLFERIASASAR